MQSTSAFITDWYRSQIPSVGLQFSDCVPVALDQNVQLVHEAPSLILPDVQTLYKSALPLGRLQRKRNIAISGRYEEYNGDILQSVDRDWGNTELCFQGYIIVQNFAGTNPVAVGMHQGPDQSSNRLGPIISRTKILAIFRYIYL
jgi:hypothetical protein